MQQLYRQNMNVIKRGRNLLSFNKASINSVRSITSISRGNNGNSGSNNDFSKALFGGSLALASAVAYSTTTNEEAHCVAARTSSSGLHPNKRSAQQVDLYPAIEPYFTKLLKVSDIHSVYYEVYGNPNGKPVLFIHGGPGGGTNPSMARFFDPAIYKIVLVDQRGCGKSLPFAELEENSTYNSIADFEKIRKELNIPRWQLFGGSWGSTLALAYAMEYPEVVTELVLRGIFLLRDKEIKWFYQGPGANYIFPEDWEIYENAIPESERHDFVKAYRRRLTGELGEEEKMKACRAWSVWEGRTCKLVQPSWEAVNADFNDKFSLAFARIENHYFWNKGFFPRDGFLLEKANIDKIRHIPTIIVQGRYDQVCPIRSAYDLKKVFSEAELIVTLAGHASMEVETRSELVKATDRFKHL